jgi:peroxiredoxin Q/BCP
MQLTNYPFIVAAGVILLLLTVFWAQAARAAPVSGKPAPDFDLLDQNGHQQRLKDYRGKWVVLYFYPKDDTPGCTTEACSFRDEYYRIRQLHAEVLGVSLDDVTSHKAFAEKYHLPFPLLADTGHQTAKDYGVYRSYGIFSLASRQTFIIDPQGKIAKHYRSVSPKLHTSQIIKDLQVLVK